MAKVITAWPPEEEPDDGRRHELERVIEELRYLVEDAARRCERAAERAEQAQQRRTFSRSERRSRAEQVFEAFLADEPLPHGSAPFDDDVDDESGGKRRLEDLRETARRTNELSLGLLERISADEALPDYRRPPSPPPIDPLVMAALTMIIERLDRIENRIAALGGNDDVCSKPGPEE